MRIDELERMDRPQFWRYFAEQYWEQRPLALRNSPVALAVTDRTLFAGLLRLTGGGAPSRARAVVNFDGRPQLTDVPSHLPHPSDDDLDGYLARMEQENGDRDWTVAVSGLHGLDAALWDAARSLSDDVLERIGTRPAGPVDMDCFIGRYASTNVGVHVDHATNFGFTIRGEKRLVTWPPDAANVPLAMRDYSAARPTADVLVGVPGGMTYFPSPQLHVGESPDSVSVSINVAFFTGTTALDVVQSALAAQADRAMSPPAPSSAPGSSELPEEFTQAAGALAATLSGAAFADALWERWSRTVTSAGLDVPRPVSDLPPPVPESRSSLASGVVLCARERGDGRYSVAAQGHVMKLAADGSSAAAVRALQDGDTVEMPPSGAGDRQSVRAMLYRLGTWGALAETRP